MDGMELYERFRSAPEAALKRIDAGRLRGKSDINPMWRIKALTEAFGPCGIGWRYTIDRQWLERGANEEISAFVNVSLYVMMGGAWSEAIPGTGGSAFVAKEKGGMYTSDECYKMALTDAISVSCKALGMAADVYWGNDRTKYSARPETERKPDAPAPTCEKCGIKIGSAQKKDKSIMTAEEVADYAKQRFGRVLCPACQAEAKAARDKERAEARAFEMELAREEGQLE